MDESEKEILRTNFSLLKDIVMTPDLIGEFNSCGLLTEEMMGRLQDEKERVRTKMFLDLLPQRGPRAFNLFINIIRRDYTWIAETLEQDLITRRETVQENESVTEDFEENCKSWLREQWESLRDNLMDHHYVSADDRNFRTISFDSMGNLIEMTVQMCKMYKTKLEEKNSIIGKLTREKEELNSELLNERQDINVVQYDLQSTNC